MSTQSDCLSLTMIGALLLAAPASGPDPVTRVEFRLSPQGRIEIPIQFDGAPSTFAFDTAAEWSAIGPRIAARLDLPKDVVRGREFVNDLSIGLGGVVLRHQRLALLSANDSALPVAADGVIGADLIGRFVPEIDFDARSLLFWTPSDFRARDYTAVPLDRDGWLAYITVSLQLPGELSPTRARLAIGTAVPSDVVLGYTFASDHGVLDRDPRATSEAVTVGMQSAQAVRLPKVGIGFGRWAIDGTDAWAFREPAVRGLLGEADGLIGLGALRRFKLAIDYRQNRLYLRPGRAKGGVRVVK